MTTSVSARQDIGFQGNRDLLHAVNTHTNLKERVLMDHFKLCRDLIEYDPQILGYSYCAYVVCVRAYVRYKTPKLSSQMIIKFSHSFFHDLTTTTTTNQLDH